MNLAKVKEKFYELVNEFYGNASVVWAEQTMTNPKVPYITLKAHDIQVSNFPIYWGTDSFYQCSVPIEMNLYTKGKQIEVEGKKIGNYENTATDDLTKFRLFLNSPWALGFMETNNIGVLLTNPVQDVSALQNDSQYRYRARAEFTVSYTMEVAGEHASVGDDVEVGSGMTVFENDENFVIDEAEVNEVNS